MIGYTDLFQYALRNVEQLPKSKPDLPADWIANNFIDPITGSLMVCHDFQKRIWNKALEITEDGRSKYDLVVWSEPKKSGKTTGAAAIGAYVACNIEAPNEICTVANDQEQSAGRIFNAMMPTLASKGWTTPPSYKSVLREPMAYGPNRSLVKAITTNYEKEAGGNQGLSLWSELWAYKGERLTRLWEEMTPPPTRKFTMRWVETYAGFIGENLLLQDLYLKVFTDFKETALRPGVIKLWDDLPVYEVDNHMLVYWSHEHRMPWQDDTYYTNQRGTLRDASYIRLHENRWVESQDIFITLQMWENSIREPVKEKPCVFALDGSKNNACTALVGCYKENNQIYTPFIFSWQPEDGQEVDFQEVEEKIYELWRTKLLRPPLYYDPYQMVKLAQDLRKRGLSCREFNQQVERSKSDTFLYKLYKEGKIINKNDINLRQHVLAASAENQSKETIKITRSGTEGGARHTERAVDLTIAQSMAAYKAYLRQGGGWGGSSNQVVKQKNDLDLLLEKVGVRR